MSNEEFISAVVAVIEGVRPDDISLNSVSPGPAESRRLSGGTGGEGVKILYNVTYTLPEGQYDTEKAYTDITIDIRVASSGNLSTLAATLRSYGSPYVATSVPDDPPWVSAYTVTIIHSPLPSHVPSSAPSCGKGLRDDGSGCQLCAPGSYSSYGGATVCQDCDVGYYCDSFGCSACERCPYPFHTVSGGSDKCVAINLHIHSIFLYVGFAVLAVIHMVCTLYVAEHKWAALILMTIPMLDVMTDILYLTLTTFYDLSTFIVCAVFVMAVPNAAFLYVVVEHHAQPRVWGESLLGYFLCLGMSKAGYPTIGGVSVFRALEVHDSIIKFSYFFMCWMLCILMQSVLLVPASVLLAVHVPFWVCWFVVGTVLYQTKVITIGPVWNLWFRVWSGNDLFDTNIDIDTRLFNKSLLSEFVLESLPQLIIQGYNNTLLDKWTLVGLISAACSAFMTVDGIWRILYYRVFSGMSYMSCPDSVIS